MSKANLSAAKDKAKRKPKKITKSALKASGSSMSVTKKQVISELAKLAFSPAPDSLAQLLPEETSEMLTPDTWRSASQVEIVKNKSGFKLSLKFYDKLSALKILASLLQKLPTKEEELEILLKIDE